MSRWQRGVVQSVFAGSLLSLAIAAQAEGLPLQMVGKQQRLSTALVSLGATQLPFPAGLIWQRADLINDQHAERIALLGMLREKMPRTGGLPRRQALIDWLAQQPVTGRELVPEADPRYLEARPDLDPVLAAQDQLAWGGVPTAVAVLGENGVPCGVQYVSGKPIRAYLQACLPDAYLSQVLLVAPDGQVSEVAVADWNGATEPNVLPGSWIWLPLPGIRDDDQLLLARQVGTLGPYMEAPAAQPSPLAVAVTQLPVSSSDWGGVGLLQVPTARMRKAGEVAITLSHGEPYTRLNVMLQPLDWLEAGFRYTDISNRDYGPEALSGSQTYKDKSIDAKFRLLSETATLPALALGFRDIAGTGLFSGEYLVASKRSQQWDFTLGLGWGYLGSRGDISSPVAFLSDSFKRRDEAEPGESNTGDWFRGATSIFGGAEWHSLNLPLSVKFEYDGNDYEHEPLGNRFDAKLPVNIGATWFAGDGVELQLAFERGDTLVAGITFHTDLSRQGMAKSNDPERTPIEPERPAADHQTDWPAVARTIARQTGSRVEDVRVAENEVQVTLTPPESAYLRPSVEEIGRILHAEAPASADWFSLGFEHRGLAAQDVTINRDELVRRETQWLPQDKRQALLFGEQPALPVADATEVLRQPPERLSTSLGIDYDQILGGPDSFLLFNIDAIAKAEFSFTESAWLAGELSVRLLDNFDDFRYTAPSGLPRVRTFQREYLLESPVNLRNLQLSKAWQMSSDKYFMLYGGFLERMFAGFGGEWLYRPFGSPVAFGIDVNRVQQRDFDIGFGLRDYRVTTGHASLYWDTGFQDILGIVRVGQYLAGDRGVTFDFSRVFRNGVKMGAYAVFTDASAEAYGEGRFTKGIYVNMPFDAVLNRSTRLFANFGWSPLARDGGAELDRSATLYDLTDLRNPRTLGLTPAR